MVCSLYRTNKRYGINASSEEESESSCDLTMDLGMKATPLACLLRRWNIRVSSCEEEVADKDSQGVLLVIERLVQIGGCEQLLLREQVMGSVSGVQPFHRICYLRPLSLALRVLEYFLDQVPEYDHWNTDAAVILGNEGDEEMVGIWLLLLRRQVLTKARFNKACKIKAIRDRVNSECERLCQKSAQSGLLCKRSAEAAGLESPNT